MMKIHLAIILIVCSVILSPHITDAKKSKKKQANQNGTQETIIIPDFTKFGEITNAIKQTMGNGTTVTTEGNVTTVSETRESPCRCALGTCSCCSRIFRQFWKQKACVDIEYQPDDFEFTAKLSMNDHIYLTRTVSGILFYFFLLYFYYSKDFIVINVQFHR